MAAAGLYEHAPGGGHGTIPFWVVISCHAAMGLGTMSGGWRIVRTMGFIGEVRVLSVIRNFIVQVPAVAGARGILLGVALGAIATGIRILTGADRPYGG